LKIIPAAFFITLFLAGCADLNNLHNSMQDSIAEIKGTYTAPLLASTPTPRTCSDTRCKTLDLLEENNYELARHKDITWVKMVDDYYQKRAELYPRSQNKTGANELRSYQRYLAEQLDSGKITESQWAYLVENKTAEINSRNQMLDNSASAAESARSAASMPLMTPPKICNTQSNGIGGYQTICN